MSAPVSADADPISDPPSSPPTWSALPLDAWQDTYLTLHRWTQVVGKVRLALAPMQNHWWNVTLHVTPRGLSTGPMPYGTRAFGMELDFIDHALKIETTTGTSAAIALAPRSVADFYQETIDRLRSLGLDVRIWSTPVEVEDRTPFELDHAHASYDPSAAERCWRVFVQVDRVMKAFGSGFLGKASPVHFFWGSFDMAASRYSGRLAPPHPGTPNVARFVMREAYSHEVSACGFWPGFGLGEPAFYAYAYPEPERYRDQPVGPDGAYYHESIREFILPYEVVRTAASPDGALLSFLRSTYEAAATTGHWDRAALER